MSGDPLEIETLEKCLEKLREHFGSVIIICTGHEEGISNFIAKRSGNYYAVKGSVITWLEDEENAALSGQINDD